MNNLTIQLADVIQEFSKEQIGGKVWRLSAALAKGMSVPNGIVIPHWVIENVAITDRRIFLKDILEMLNEINCYAVRSSSTFEDNPIASGAGIFKSILAVKGKDQIVEAVLECWNELCSPLVLRYTERLGASNLMLHIFIQEMVMPKRSGVAIIGRPEPNQCMIEGVWGLGAGVVSGEVSPDFVSAQLKDANIITLRRGNQQTVMSASSEGGIYYKSIVKENEAPVFDQKFVNELSHFLRELVSFFGSEQEVEWAEDGQGKIRLLQIRPLTSKTAFKSC
ncbi:PEP/pyruvate-binding domain-containing protein [Paenibacillus agilis]|uniref:Phosphoenolpyruvate synthase n=1 Tax=Paenibacillus agilis TaxID=3020863 RepID=A0A559J138_9BACL|nr:PEP/pyruvate-binding domain-containing protein [Paenibacillus agilis]TVX93563.1 hypothetical protein FPZ44_11160 [Paenibacillus agilis]